MLKTRFLLLLVGALLACAPTANAATVTLQWNSGTESDLAGYAVVYGTASRQYSATIDVGNHTSVQVPNLAPGQVYYFAVVSYNTAGLKSAFSTEVNAAIPMTPLSLTTLTSTAGSVTVGTSVTFAAAASGGTGAYEYKWLVKKGGVTSIAQSWSGNNVLLYSPSTATSYTVTAWVRNIGVTTDAPENASAARSVSLTATAAPVVTRSYNTCVMKNRRLVCSR